MTKEEILKSHFGCGCHEIYTSRGKKDPSCTLHTEGPEIELAMDEYAEIEAVSFAEWIAKEGWYYNKIQRWSNRNEKSENLIEVLGNTKSTSELFQLYKTQQTK